MVGVVSLFTTERSTPKDLRRSPDPEEDVEALPPCLQTLRPIPAATIAADVETLNVFFPSPPVPTMSMKPFGLKLDAGITSENSKIVETAAAMNSGWWSKPLIRRAVRKAEVWTSEDVPMKMCLRTDAKSSGVKFGGWRNKDFM
ncbi:hypothetical protein OXX59_008272 [Metschnikowia pulcherrima]